MIRKLVRQMLTAQILSALTVSLCLLIDSIMVSRFLGEEAIAAFGLANPVLLAIGAVGTLLSAGIQVTCSKSLGRGSQEETNAGYSSAVLTAGILSAAFTAGVLAFAPFLARALGAGREGTLFGMTRDYLVGFSIGAPGSMGALVLVPFLQMAGQNNLLIAAVLSMTLADVSFDLLSVLVFRGGMFGMGLASALSYYVALGIGAFYFCSRRCVFRFSLRQVTRRKIAELFRNGIPAGFTMGSTMILVFFLNRILRGTGGSAAVAAYAVISSIGNAAFCISSGIAGTSLTLTGIFFHEEDRTALCKVIRYLCRHAVLLGLGMGVLLAVFAPQLIGLFVPDEGPTRMMAVLGLRIFAAGLIPCCVNSALKNAYQATGRVALTEAISVLEGAVLPVLAAFVLSRFLGTTGVWFYSAAGEALTLIGLGLFILLRTHTLPWRDGACLLLPEGFSVPPDETLEMRIHGMEEVSEAARRAEEFCRSRGQGERVGKHIALCIEEMAGNTIRHGFVKDGRRHHLSVRILHRKDGWILRFRDDCGAFDPVSYVPGEGHTGVGIRLVMSIAREASYTYSLNLNNLLLKLPGD